MSAQNIAASVDKLVEPIVKSLGLFVWDVQYVKEGSSMILRILIDKENGVTLDDCETVSRAIDTPLDDYDLIQDSYCLEVSSPGLERELTRPEHFKLLEGEMVKIRTLRPLEDDKRDFIGKLLGFSDGIITLDVSGEKIEIAKSEIAFCRLFEEVNFNGGIGENE